MGPLTVNEIVDVRFKESRAPFTKDVPRRDMGVRTVKSWLTKYTTSNARLAPLLSIMETVNVPGCVGLPMQLVLGAQAADATLLESWTVMLQFILIVVRERQVFKAGLHVDWRDLFVQVKNDPATLVEDTVTTAGEPTMFCLEIKALTRDAPMVVGALR
jgi:hypothetical protein